MKLVVKTLIIFGFVASLSACLPTEQEIQDQQMQDAEEAAAVVGPAT